VPTVAGVVAAEIAAAGVTRVFTFPGGGSNLPVLDCLDELGVDVSLVRSEDGGAFMAATAGDLTARPGVLLVGLGPGAASAANGVAHAWLDRSPLVLIVDRFSPGEARSSGHQLIDHSALFAPITKAQIVLTADDAGAAVRDALELSLAQPRGPVLLELARDVARLPANDERRVSTAWTTAERTARDLGEGLVALAEARRPVILVGLEARYGDNGALVALAERLSAPVLATYKGKGAFPESHPLFAGIVTGAAIDRQVLGRADFLLGVGVDPVELLPREWSYDAPMLALRFGDDARDPYFGARSTLGGPLGDSVDEIAGALSHTRSEWTAGDVQTLAKSVLDSLRVDGGPLTAWNVVECVQAEVGDAIVSVDAGAHMFAATWFWRSERRNRFLISNGLASMGYAVPAAIAASLVEPQETVVAFTGDGGFMLNAAELETAARLGVKAIVVVLNDASLSLIRVKQDEQRLTRCSLDYLRSDFAALARSLGVHGATARDEPELRRAVQAAREADGTTVIDVRIDGSEYTELNRLIRG
jgi:acetolactate synthase-1/2/3 large subunit